MKITAIGDSLTYGYLLNENEKWTNKLAKKLNNDIINKGQNADVSSNLLKRFKTDVVDIKTDLVIIWIGVNDFFEDVSLIDVTENINRMLEISKQNKIIPVIVISPPVNRDMESFYPFDFKTEAVNDKILEMKKYYLGKNLHLIDLYEAFENYEGDKNSLYIDDIHISSKGTDLVFNIIFKYLDKLIGNEN